MPTPSTAEDSPIDAPRADRDAFVGVLRSHDDRLRGLAYKLLGGDRDRMDDALQDAYLRAYAALPRFRRESDVGTWLYRIVYNACVDELRRGGRRPEPVDVTTPGFDRPSARPGPDAVVSAADATVRALAALPVDQRVTVVLVDGEGFDNVDAARILGVAPGTIASRLSRARAALRKVLDDEVLDDKVLDDKVLDDKVLDDEVLDDEVLDDTVLDDEVLGDDAEEAEEEDDGERER